MGFDLLTYELHPNVSTLPATYLSTEYNDKLGNWHLKLTIAQKTEINLRAHY